jgi:ribose 5-phosphate isomerase
MSVMRVEEFVPSGMKVGLGTGSTAIFATQRIADIGYPVEWPKDIAADPAER